MQWGEQTSSRGVLERPFHLEVDGRGVPGILWQAEDVAGRAPLVLVGHGGTQHKRAGYILTVARLLARHHGIASFAIDGPGHGEREGGSSSTEGFEAAWQQDGVDEQTVTDWRFTLDAMVSELSPGPIGYWGLSMGTMMGVPVVAAEPRIEVALLGLMGFRGFNEARLRRDAPRVNCPVRFLLQWDDELVDREAGFALFDALGTEDKTLRANPGLHAAVPPVEFRSSVDFLADHLASE